MRKLTTPEINWSALPFFRLTLPLMLGIYLAEKVNFHHFSLHILSFLSFLSILYFQRPIQIFKKRWTSGVAINIFLVLLGYQLTYFHNETKHTLHFQNHITQKNWIIGTITNMPTLGTSTSKIELTIQLIGNKKESLETAKGNLLVYLKSAAAVNLSYGDQLLLHSKITPTQKAKNPNAFDYSSYLHLKNIHFQTFAQRNWKKIASNQGYSHWHELYRLRINCLKILRKYITTPNELAIASALILGYKNDLSYDLKNTYAETGAIHVLAVSGLHIGIISSFLFFLLNLLPFKGRNWNWVKLSIILMTIWGFALLTGLSSSVLRAAMMFSVFSISLVIQRNVNRYNSLAIAAFMILLLKPYALFEVGFQFSFLAVLGIVFFLPKFKNIWVPKNKLLYNIWVLFLVGVSAQLALSPLVLYYFHQMPTYFWLSGILVVPLAGIIMKLGLILLFVNLINEWIAYYVGFVLTQIIATQNTLIDWILKLPFPIFSGFWINHWEVLFFYGTILGFAMLFLVPRFRYILISLACLLVVSGVQLAEKLVQAKQKKLVVYNIPKKGMIDFIDGHTVYEFGKEKLEAQQFIYGVQGNRWAKGIKEEISIDSSHLEKGNLLRVDNYFKFYDQRLVIVDEALPQKGNLTEPLKCNYLLLQNSPKLKIRNLQNYYAFKQLIFDGSNSFWIIENWKKQCAALNIEYIDVKSDGAMVIDLNQTKPIITEGEDQTAAIINPKHFPEPSLEFPPNIVDD